MAKKISLALIGAGAMGGAMMRGWIDASVIEPAESAAFDPHINEHFAAELGGKNVRVNPELGGGFDVVVLAVKPQVAANVLPAYVALMEGACVVSVMAGLTVETIKGLTLGARCLVRAMPNLPASVGAGATGLFSEQISEGDKAAVTALMEASGTAVWVDVEKEIDVVAAISGSGPAYFFLLVEALVEAGMDAGLSEDKAAALARQTLIGAGALIHQDNRVPQDLRAAVTSPGGTTAAAINAYESESDNFRGLVARAVAAAVKRAGELSG